MSDETITKFKGPGQWRSQAARLEKPSTIKRLAEKAKNAKMKE